MIETHAHSHVFRLHPPFVQRIAKLSIEFQRMTNVNICPSHTISHGSEDFGWNETKKDEKYCAFTQRTRTVYHKIISQFNSASHQYPADHNITTIFATASVLKLNRIWRECVKRDGQTKDDRRGKVERNILGNRKGVSFDSYRTWILSQPFYLRLFCTRRCSAFRIVMPGHTLFLLWSCVDSSSAKS